MARPSVACALVGVVLAGCPMPTASTSVMVTGPRDWLPPEAMTLEIGDGAWSITPDGAGVASETLTTISEVRLVGLEECHVYARFVAVPGSAYVIRFAADGSVDIEDVCGGFLEAGPALTEAAPADC